MYKYISDISTEDMDTLRANILEHTGKTLDDYTIKTVLIQSIILGFVRYADSTVQDVSDQSTPTPNTCVLEEETKLSTGGGEKVDWPAGIPEEYYGLKGLSVFLSDTIPPGTVILQNSKEGGA